MFMCYGTQHESLAFKDREHPCPCSHRREVNSIEFFVLFDTTFLKDFGKAKQNCQKMLAFTVELFNLAKARDFPESASVFQ